jgi:hypothetical protein
LILIVPVRNKGIIIISCVFAAYNGFQRSFYNNYSRVTNGRIFRYFRKICPPQPHTGCDYGGFLRLFLNFSSLLKALSAGCYTSEGQEAV